MENETEQQLYNQIKELYKDLQKERAKEKRKNYDKEYRRKRYHEDPEFNQQCKLRALSSYYRRKQKKITENTTENI